MEYTKEELIQLRKGYLPYDEAKKVQKKLIAIYKKEYKPKYTSSKYYKIIIDNNVTTIEERHPQDTNFADKVFTCFSVVSQHVRGYTKEHCLDQIQDCVIARKKRIKEYKLLPTLKELVDSSIIIEPDKMYYTKEKETYEDSCYGYSGNAIIKMRSVGILNYFVESNKHLLKSFFENLDK